MARGENRRKVERIALLPHLPGRSSQGALELAEVSMGGAKLQHYHEIPIGSKVDLRFEWQGTEISVRGEVVRSTVERFGSSSIYHSGVRFELDNDESRAQVRKLIGFHVKRALDRQIENASGTTSYSSRLMRDAASGDEIAFGIEGPLREIDPAIQAMRDQGYVRYSLKNGLWYRERTFEPAQPIDGFTIWMFEDCEEAELLCRDYESSSSQTRDLIRICAELSLFVDDRIPPQCFTP